MRLKSIRLRTCRELDSSRLVPGSMKKAHILLGGVEPPQMVRIGLGTLGQIEEIYVI